MPTKATPWATISTPTTKPSAQPAVEGNPVQVRKPSTSEMIPLASAQPQRPVNSRQCSIAYMMLVMPSIRKNTINR
jgi:hypothetical protein